MEQYPDIQELLVKVQRQQASATELSVLMEWIRNDDSGERILVMQEHLQLPADVKDTDDPAMQEYWNVIAAKVLQADNAAPEQDNSRPTHRLHFFKRNWWAAASILLILFAGVLIWLNTSRTSPTATSHHTGPADIAPGRDGAVLTLADGQQLVLDSLKNGVVAVQGAAKAVLQNGQLIYQSEAGSNIAAYNTMTTPKGRQFHIKLPDGSDAWLNAESSIRFPTVFTGSERRVAVTGEVYFEVTHDTAKPFWVYFSSPTGGGREGAVEVLGTHFNINAYHDETDTRITLLEGSVRLVHNAEHKMLKPGEQGLINLSTPPERQGEAIKVITPDLEEVMAWKEGYFFFNQADLPAVMRQLARWYDVEIVYEGPAPVMTFWGGIARNSNLSQVLKILEKSNVHFRIEGKKIIVTQ